jgi:hypothetical protein
MTNMDKYFNRQIMLAICLIIISTTINAQKVKIKNGKVAINETEVFNYKEGKNDISLFNINTNEEIIFIKKNAGKITEGDDKYKDDFVTYMFLKEKIKVEISTTKYDIGFLFNQGVFDLSGNLDSDKILLFKEKYDENISGKTIIIK